MKNCSHLPLAALAVALLIFAACSKDKLTELADKAKQAVSDGADKVKQQAGVVADSAKEQLALAGSCEITLDQAMTTNACYYAWIPQGSGRLQVLQLRSYREISQESFPSVLVHSQVAAGGVSELVGQTVAAQLFLQSSADQPVWSCPPGGHIDVKVVAVDDRQLQLEIVGGSVRNSQTGATQTVTGKLIGVPQ